MIEKLNAILALFTPERPEWAAADVANALSIPRSTSYRLLSRISGAGFIDTDRASGRYRLGLRVASLGVIAQRSTALQRAAYPVLQRLAWESQETAALLVRLDSHAVLSAMADGPRSPVSPLLGERTPLHATAGGRAILSALPDEERRTMLRGSLASATATAIPDPAALDGALLDAREAGVSVMRGGAWRDGDVGVASPVRNPGRSVVSSVMLAGPASRLTDARVQELGALVAQAAAEVALAYRALEATLRSDDVGARAVAG
ncbi:MAG: IclR family transcriptional regulator [Gemmatimonadaceae bacterium]|nr:IclR family transcriptional regulator [Gemmatimonadaceae bacterium]